MAQNIRIPNHRTPYEHYIRIRRPDVLSLLRRYKVPPEQNWGDLLNLAFGKGEKVLRTLLNPWLQSRSSENLQETRQAVIELTLHLLHKARLTDEQKLGHLRVILKHAPVPSPERFCESVLSSFQTTQLDGVRMARIVARALVEQNRLPASKWMLRVRRQCPELSQAICEVLPGRRKRAIEQLAEGNEVGECQKGWVRSEKLLQ